MNDENISNNVKKISSVNGMPLSKGSDGYNKQQCYVMKNHLPDQTLCSIYGPSGSYKSFLAVSWACHLCRPLDHDDHFKGRRPQNPVGCMVGVVSAGIDATRFQPGIRPRETQAEELRPDMRSVCELDDNTVLAQAIAILPARGEYSAICQ